MRRGRCGEGGWYVGAGVIAAKSPQLEVGQVVVVAHTELFGGEAICGSEGAAEGARVEESGVPGDLLDGRCCMPKRFGGMAKAKVDQILIRCPAEDGLEVTDQLGAG